MGNIWRKGIKGNSWFFVLAVFSIALITASWVVPPLGVIDNSVLAAIGEICGIMGIGTVLKALDSGTKATAKHGATEITVHTKEEQQQQIRGPWDGKK